MSFDFEALEKAAHEPRWISFKDQEPPLAKCPSAPFGEPVLVTNGKMIAVAAWGLRPELDLHSYMFGKYEVGRSESEWWMGKTKLTHWMPLPALPGEEVITNDSERKGRVET